MRQILSYIIVGCTFLFSQSIWAGSVDRAQFTTGIQDREPVDHVETLSMDHDQVKYFTDLKDLQGHTVTHQWVHDDEIMFEKSFDVGGNRWRVWTSKSLQPGWSGLWIVNTLDGERNKLLTQSFLYQ